METIDSFEEELQLIVFRLGEEEYAVPIQVVQEIITPKKAVHLPNTPYFVQGVTNLRGNIIPIINGRAKFNIMGVTNPIEPRIIIFEINERTIGLSVDSVSEVVYLEKKNIVHTSAETSSIHNFIQGIGKFRNRLLLIINPEKLLSNKEVKSINTTIESFKNLSQSRENKSSTL
jgi:purine-binding chemotaxis protein CheW